MHHLEKFYIKTIKYELINKFVYINTANLPELRKITLNFGCKTADIKQLSSGLLAFELILCQKGKLTTTKQSNILFKIRKGNPTGCKVTLSKHKLFNFFSIMLVEILPKLKNFTSFTKKINTNAFSYQLAETFYFSELENYYHLFNNLPILNVSIVTNSKTKKEIIFLLKSFKLPL
jgi:large subunit ribosomal protein L5